MPKRSAPPAAAMPTGQVFRRSQSAKKQKTGGEEAKAVLNGATASNGKAHAKPVGHSAGEMAEKGRAKSVEEPSPVTEKETVKPAPSTSMIKPSRKSNDAKRSRESDAKAQRSNHVPRTFRIVVGSYERMLFGFHVKLRDMHDDHDAEQAAGKGVKHHDWRAVFLPLFSFAAHTSCISAVAAAGSDSKWLATGAGDESVRVWDLRKRKEVGTLTGHGGTIHSLHFPTRTYLLSSDSSGLINLYRTRDWALLKTLRGHTGRVNACAAHPSGKLALSVGQDGMLRMWDLMRGKGAGAVRLNLGRVEASVPKGSDEEESGLVLNYAKVKHEPLDVQWNPSGTRFMVFARTEVAIYKTDMTKTASVLIRHDNPKQKINCIAWLNDQVILCGTESGLVDIYAVKDDTIRGPIGLLSGHSNRVRAIRIITVKPKPEQDALHLTVTACSDGKVRIFDVSNVSADVVTDDIQELKSFSEHDTGGARLTSLDVVGGAGVRTAASDTIETDVEADMDDEEEEDEEGDEGDEAQLDADDVQELNDLLDIIEEAREQGIEIDGMSDLEALAGEGDGDSDSDDYGSDVDDAEEEEEEEEEEEG